MSIGKIIKFEGKTFKLKEIDGNGGTSCAGCYFLGKNINGKDCGDFKELDCIKGVERGKEGIFIEFKPEPGIKKKLKL